jgi:D-3-phosphoglycerate dehydrogenase / 2-oxoglutarate reductase
MSYSVLVADKVTRSGLYPLTDDPAFEVLSVDDSHSEEFDGVLANAEALIVRSATTVSRELISRAPKLSAVGRAGVGVDNIDIPAATEQGVAVFNAPGGNTIAAAELTMGLILSVARRIAAADASVRAGRWDRAAFKGVELRGKMLGLIGAGRIGGEVARLSRAFGMGVIAYDPYLTEERALDLGVPLVSLEEVLDNGDFISVHVPLTDETRGICGPNELKRVKSTAFVVNASRGGVVDEEALASALRSGDIAGAALDVYENEPLPEDSPLRGAPNLVLTPHVGASTGEAQVSVATEVARKIRDWLLEGDHSDALNGAEL